MNTHPFGEVVYTSRNGFKVVRLESGTVRVLEPSGYWLRSDRACRVLSFRSVATGCKRADKEDRRLAAGVQL